MDNEEKKVRDINISTDEAAKTEIFHHPIGKSSKGKVRDDRGVIITNEKGESRRTTGVMLGYNKYGLELENGTYISWEEIAEAIIEETTSIGENERVIVKKTGRTIQPAEMVEDIRDAVITAHSHLKVTPREDLSYTKSKEMKIIEAGEDKEERVSPLVLGKSGVQLPEGEYLSLEAIQAALTEYAIETVEEKKEEPIPTKTTPQEEEKREIHKLKYRNRSKIPAIVLASITTITMIASMIGTRIIDSQLYKYIEKLSYNISHSEQIEVAPTDEELRKMGVDLNTGDQVNIPTGVTFHESSDYDYGGKNNTGETKEGGIREAGDYTAEYISVVYQGKIQNVVYEAGVNVGDVINAEAERLGCDPQELRPMIHLGNQVCGWVDLDEVAKARYEQGEIDNIIVEQNVDLTGTVDYSEEITIDNGTGQNVTLRVVDDNGVLLAPGTTVVGSDGLEYTINELSPEYSVSDTADVQEKLTFSIRNISPEEALAIAGLASATALALGASFTSENVELTDAEVESMVEKAQSQFDSASETKKTKKILGEREPSEMTDELVGRQVAVKDFLEASGYEDVPKHVQGFEESKSDYISPQASQQGGRKK